MSEQERKDFVTSGKARLMRLLDKDGTGNGGLFPMNVPLDKLKAELLTHGYTEEAIDWALIETGRKTDVEKAARIFTRRGQAEEFAQRQPIFYDKAGLFWIWLNDLKCWQMVDEVELLNSMEDSMGVDIINSKNRGEIINSLKQIGRRNIPLESPKTWIQFKNGLIDILDPENLIIPSPKYFITNPLPWQIDESDETPNIDRIFTEWVGENQKKLLYEIIAYSMLSDYPIHRIFCFIGSGLNGKSCYLTLLRSVIGKENITSSELDTLLSSRFEVTRLHKKLVCQMGETNFTEMSKTSILKKLSGGDLIGFEYKGKTPFEDTNYAKIIIATNNLPSTSDKTLGFYRRWIIIDFPNTFTEKKDILKDIPEIEFARLNRKCVSLLKELLDKREFTNEGTIEERMKKYEDHSDPLEKFIKEFTIEDGETYIFKWEFEKRLNQWCKENRHRIMSEVMIGKKMKEKGIESIQRLADWYTQEGTRKTLRAWSGLKWKGAING